jgi:hypothetical protein
MMCRPIANQLGRTCPALLALAAMASAQQPSEFAGTWVLREEGQNILKLTLVQKGNDISGALTKPKTLTIDQAGNISGVGAAQITQPVQKSELRASKLELTIDGDRLDMTLVDRNHALLVLEGMRPWKLERAATGDTVQLATSLAQSEYSEEIRSLRARLRTMVEEEQAVRLALDTARMEIMDAKNRPEVMRIFRQYGWVTYSLAGKDASHDFWLLVQHQTPEIQQQLLPALEKAAKAGDASMSDYAYLFDRVQVGLGKPQRWGTQVKCEAGKPVLAPVDDLKAMDARRNELFLQPIDEYLRSDYLVKFCAKGAK